MSITLNEMTQQELGALAQRLRVKGYSRMRVNELRSALVPFFPEGVQDFVLEAVTRARQSSQSDVKNCA